MFEDARGFFFESFNQRDFQNVIGRDVQFEDLYYRWSKDFLEAGKKRTTVAMSACGIGAAKCLFLMAIVVSVQPTKWTTTLSDPSQRMFSGFKVF